MMISFTDHPEQEWEKLAQRVKNNQPEPQRTTIRFAQHPRDHSCRSTIAPR
jgi:hypothetical protein